MILGVAVALAGPLSPARGQGIVKLGVFADTLGSDCDIMIGAGLITVEVVVVDTPAKSAQFSAPAPECLQATWIGDEVSESFLRVGDSQSGVTLAFGVPHGPFCTTVPYHIMTIKYFAPPDPAPGCCDYPVLPHPLATSGEIEVSSCNDELAYAQGLTATITSDAVSCGCVVAPVEASTWGAVKALYR